MCGSIVPNEALYRYDGTAAETTQENSMCTTCYVTRILSTNKSDQYSRFSHLLLDTTDVCFRHVVLEWCGLPPALVRISGSMYMIQLCMGVPSLSTVLSHRRRATPVEQQKVLQVAILWPVLAHPTNGCVSQVWQSSSDTTAVIPIPRWPIPRWSPCVTTSGLPLF